MPNNTEQVNYALQLAKNGNLNEALLILENLIKHDKKNFNAFMLSAEIYARTNNHKASEKHYLKAIKITPDNLQANLKLAMLFHSTGKFKKSKPYYLKALKIENNQPTTHFNFASTLQELNQLDDAIKHYNIAISQNPQYTKSYANLGYLYRQSNNIESSISNYLNAIKCASNIPDIHYNLGLSYLAIGQTENAEKSIKSALKLNPDYLDAWCGLGSVYAYKDLSHKAISSYKKALNHGKNHIDSLKGMCLAHSSLGLHEQALKYINDAIKIEPNNNELIFLEGQIYSALGDLKKSLQICKSLLAINPDNKRAVSLCGSIYYKKGNSKKAYSYISPLLNAENTDIDIALSFSAMSKSLNKTNEAIEILSKILDCKENIQPSHKRHLYFSLGKAQDNFNDYDNAFDSYRKGNNLKNSSFNISVFQNEIDSIINVFSKSFFTQQVSNNTSPKPIFIIGMPRSGTSLVEQILSSHPDIFGAGELPDIFEFISEISSSLKQGTTFPDCMSSFKSQHINKYVDKYLAHINKISSTEIYVTDKMPTNFMHAGFIRILFPNSKIIHCTRDPLDTSLSCYFQDFGRNHPWIYKLKDIAVFYKGYERLMRHWKTIPNMNLYEVNYEELVTKQEQTSKNLLQFIGLNWNIDCLEFHNNDRFVWTASHEQVRQPIYNKSVARWKHYQFHLQELITEFKYLKQ